MTRDEFDAWGDDLGKRLPDTGAYLRSLPQDVRDFWFDQTFRRLFLEDCIEANKRLTQEGLPAYDRERLAEIISKHATQAAYDRRQREEEASRDNRPAKRGGGVTSEVTRSFNPVMKACLKAMDGHDFSPAQRRDFIDQFFAKHDAEVELPEDGPRYSCSLCLGSGYVLIWSPAAMQAAIDFRLSRISVTEFQASKHRMQCACSCHLGDSTESINTVRNGRVVELRKLIRYCSQRTVHAHPNVGDKLLLEWADWFIEERRNGVEYPVLKRLGKEPEHQQQEMAF